MGKEDGNSAVVATQSTMIRDLQKKVQELTAEATDRRMKAKGIRKEAEELKAQLETLKTEHEKQIAELTAERDSLKRDPDAKDAKILELEGAIRERAHKDKFAEVAAKAGIPPDRIEGAWKLSAYKAEGEPDETKIMAQLGETVRAHPYLHRDAAGVKPADAARAATQPLTSPWDGGRGAPVATPNALRVRKSDLQNPAWKLDPRNEAMLRDAAKNHVPLEIIEDVGPGMPAGGNAFANDIYRGG